MNSIRVGQELMRILDPVKATTYQFKKDDVIYAAGTSVTTLYMVSRGFVVTCPNIPAEDRVVEDGHVVQKMVFGFYGAWEYFGEHDFIDGSIYGEDAIAWTDCEVLGWPFSDVFNRIGKSPQLLLSLLRLMAQKKLALERQKQILFLHNEERLWAVIQEVLAPHGQRREDGSLSLPVFLHEDLAVLCGTSRTQVTKFLNKFKREGRIRYSSRQFLILPGR